jgi:hypothetical protein
LGLGKVTSAASHLSRIRSAGINTEAGRTISFPGGFRLVEIKVNARPQIAAKLASKLAADSSSSFDLITVYDVSGNGFTRAAKKQWRSYEKNPARLKSNSPQPKKSSRVAQELDSLGITESKAKSLVTALQKLWEESEDSYAGVSDNHDFENLSVREFVADNAPELLSESDREIWMGLESEGQAYLLALAFPYDSADTVKRLRNHFSNQTRGASKEEKPSTLESSQDPTDFTSTASDLEKFSSGNTINSAFDSETDTDEIYDDPAEIIMSYKKSTF